MSDAKLCSYRWYIEKIHHERITYQNHVRASELRFTKKIIKYSRRARTGH